MGVIHCLFWGEETSSMMMDGHTCRPRLRFMALDDGDTSATRGRTSPRVEAVIASRPKQIVLQNRLQLIEVPDAIYGQ